LVGCDSVGLGLLLFGSVGLVLVGFRSVGSDLVCSSLVRRGSFQFDLLWLYLVWFRLVRFGVYGFQGSRFMVQGLGFFPLQGSVFDPV